MKVKNLLKKYNLDRYIELSDVLLNIDVGGEYNNFEKKKLILDNSIIMGFSKKEFEGYKFIGENCECFIIPDNNVRTLIYYYKKDNFTHGYSYNSKGEISSIV